MTIQQCKYVLKIAKTGFFNEAAKQLFIAQSSLSQSVKSLEQELNIKIFERSGNGVYLTEDGAEFVRYASQIAEHDDFIAKRYSAQNIRQKLYIATQHYDFIADIFGKMLSEMQEDDYKFSLREIQTYEVIHELETAYSDIGIIAIKDSDYEIMKRYLHKKGLTFTAFLEASPHVFLLTDSYTIGTGIMPSALNRGDIVSIPLESEEFYIIGYLLNADRKVSPLTEKFIQLLIEATKDI